MGAANSVAVSVASFVIVAAAVVAAAADSDDFSRPIFCNMPLSFEFL